MKKFVFLATGCKPPTDDIMQGWNSWFASFKENIVDMGSHFGPGKEITADGVKDLPQDLQAIAGYMIVSAKNMQEAEKIAKSCPIITSMRIYEAMRGEM